MMLQVETQPSAYITVNKGRRKVKEDKFVYLKNGQEFEIELFNPTQSTVLTKIWINNKIMSTSGIVLRPGERVFLERYIDVPKKFLFDTYEVGSDSKAVQKAIEKNGLVRVEFFNEDTTSDYCGTVTLTGSAHTTFPFYDTNVYNTCTDTLSFGDTSSRSFTSTNTSGNLTFGSVGSQVTASGNMSYAEGNNTPKDFQSKARLGKRSKSKKTETGRVEQGSHSEQSFTTVNKKFYSWACRTIELQIKPTSQQVIDRRQIVTSKYCTGCGTKAKSAHKFCSTCGVKL